MLIRQDTNLFLLRRVLRYECLTKHFSYTPTTPRLLVKKLVKKNVSILLELGCHLIHRAGAELVLADVLVQKLHVGVGAQVPSLPIELLSLQLIQSHVLFSFLELALVEPAADAVPGLVCHKDLHY